MPPEHCWTLGLVENLTPVGTNQIIKHIDGFLKFDSKNHKSVKEIGGGGHICQNIEMIFQWS